MCGDQVAIGDEECDGTDLKGADCKLFGYSTKAGLGCGADCKFDMSGCNTTCDGLLLEPGEECDGVDLGIHDCTEFGFTKKQGAKCNATCTGIEIGNCGPTCDGAGLEVGEECDGANLGGMTCTDFGFDNPGGLACGATCTPNAAGCTPVCNGNNLEPGEACDGANLGGKTCTDLGFVNPAGLSCGPACAHDASMCVAACGNQVMEPGEECDGAAGAGQVCRANCTLKLTAVINEIWYDPPGADGTSAACFIEILGDPGLDLTGYSLKFTRGSDGAEYVAALALTGKTIGPDGYFVVVQTAGQMAALPAGANSVTSTKADMQNGPNNLALVKGNVVVDAIGYGSFVANFAGEGTAVPSPVNSAKTLSRLPNGADSDDNLTDFKLGTPTPGAANMP